MAAISPQLTRHLGSLQRNSVGRQLCSELSLQLSGLVTKLALKGRGLKGSLQGDACQNSSFVWLSGKGLSLSTAP